MRSFRQSSRNRAPSSPRSRSDANIPSTGDEEYDRRTLHSFLGYTAFSGVRMRDGDIVNDPSFPAFRVAAQPDDRVPSDAPMFNPFGRWKLGAIDASQN
jgi:hypothetical protein